MLRFSLFISPLILTVILAFNLCAQDYALDYSIGNFNSAVSFSINSSGFIYVVDDGDDSLLKLDTLGNQINEIGGRGWGQSTFDNPVDVFATTLNVFVCDKQNSRIKFFDKDLNFISELYTRESDISEERFGYPTSCAVSFMGDLYVLDLENIRVVKFDLFGNFLINFGGFDAGVYSLQHPKKLVMGYQNSVIVLDDSALVVFDQFGNGRERIGLTKKFTNINISNAGLILNNEFEIYLQTLNDGENQLRKVNLIGGENLSEIMDCSLFNNQLYVLTQDEIYVFRKVKN
jgi:DNA-binding beta-propeller fold protein YncE